MAVKQCFLIYRQGGAVRVTSRYPSLRMDEVAFRVHINTPDGWGHVLEGHGLSLNVPGPPEGVEGEQMDDGE